MQNYRIHICKQNECLEDWYDDAENNIRKRLNSFNACYVTNANMWSAWMKKLVTLKRLKKSNASLFNDGIIDSTLSPPGSRPPSPPGVRLGNLGLCIFRFSSHTVHVASGIYRFTNGTIVGHRTEFWILRLSFYTCSVRRFPSRYSWRTRLNAVSKFQPSCVWPNGKDFLPSVRILISNRSVQKRSKFFNFLKRIWTVLNFGFELWKMVNKCPLTLASSSDAQALYATHVHFCPFLYGRIRRLTCVAVSILKTLQFNSRAI